MNDFGTVRTQAKGAGCGPTATSVQEMYSHRSTRKLALKAASPAVGSAISAYPCRSTCDPSAMPTLEIRVNRLEDEEGAKTDPIVELDQFGGGNRDEGERDVTYKQADNEDLWLFGLQKKEESGK